jgi:glycosyltransferase involved in cell wall biosynthesis
MRILIIPSWYPSKGAPVNGVFFKEQAIALAKHGHDVAVIDVTFHGRKDIFNATNFRLIDENVDGVHTYSFRIPSFFILSRIQPLFIWIYKLLLFFVFRKLCRKGLKFDVLHAHSFYPAGFSACSLSKKYNIPVVITEHSSAVIMRQLSGYQQKLLAKTVKNSNVFICVSESLLQSVKEQTKIEHNKLITVPNIVTSAFTYSKEKHVKNQDFLFLSVGFFSEGKRHSFLISCFEEAFTGRRDVKLQIAGDGEQYASLQHQIKKGGLTEQIRLLGNLGRTQLALKYEECNAFVLASAFETFGVVYIEAMACGKPVIATRNGGANNIVNDTNGILIDVDNREQLIEAFRYMYHNAHKYNSEQIAADCRAKYSEAAVAGKLSEVYRQVLNK